MELTWLRSSRAQRRAIYAEAMGDGLKDHEAEVLINAIKKVHEGELWLDRSLTATMLDELRQGRKSDPEQAKIDSITNRELEVLALVTEGLRSKEIAQRLFISESTVTHHLSSIFSKLEVSDRMELMLYAFRHGLARVPPPPEK